MGPGLLRGETGCPYHFSCLQFPSPLQALRSLAGLSNSWSEEGLSEDKQDTRSDYLSWLGNEGQEWAQACSDVRQAVHTTSPVFKSSPLQALRSLASLSQSCSEEGPTEDKQETRIEYLA